MGVISVCFIVWFAICFYFDSTKARIPNALNVAGALAGFVLQVVLNGWSGLFDAVFGFFLGFFVIYLLYQVGALAAGDVKWFAAAGTLLGPQLILLLMMFSVLYAGVLGVIVFIGQNERMKRLKRVFSDKKETSLTRIPFMYAVFPAGITLFLYY